MLVLQWQFWLRRQNWRFFCCCFFADGTACEWWEVTADYVDVDDYNDVDNGARDNDDNDSYNNDNDNDESEIERNERGNENNDYWEKGDDKDDENYQIPRRMVDGSWTLTSCQPYRVISWRFKESDNEDEDGVSC